jgi:beta-glucosidase
MCTFALARRLPQRFCTLVIVRCCRASLVVLFALVAACNKDPELVQLKIMTINLRHDVDWWEERFPLIADEIVRLEPDLIGMQEVEIAQTQSQALLDLIAARTPADGLYYEYHEEMKTGLAALGGEGIGVFSRYPISVKLSRDLLYGRVVQLDRIKISEKLTIDLYNTHLHNEGGDEVRKPQMESILAFVEENKAGYLTFLTGDMNAKDTSETIRYAVDHGFIDTYRAVHGDDTERIGNTSPIHLAKEPVAQDPTNRIDYVFMQKPPEKVALAVVSSTVAFDHPNADGLYPSDHLGVMSTFEIDLNTL